MFLAPFFEKGRGFDLRCTVPRQESSIRPPSSSYHPSLRWPRSYRTGSPPACVTGTCLTKECKEYIESYQTTVGARDTALYLQRQGITRRDLAVRAYAHKLRHCCVIGVLDGDEKLRPVCEPGLELWVDV